MSWTCLVSMRIWTNMVHVQYNLRECYVPIQLHRWGLHLSTFASKFSSLTDSTQGFWLVTYFPSYLWTILYMNKLSILLGCQCCEKWSQIIHKNLIKTSKTSHYKFISNTELNFKTNISNQNIEVYLSIYNTVDTPSNGISWWTLKFTNVKFGPEYVISC